MGTGMRGLLAVGTALIVAAVVAACGTSGGAGTTIDVDPLTETVPASTLPADTPVEPGLFRLVGHASLGYDLVRSAAARALFGAQGLSLRLRTTASNDDVLAALRSGAADGAVVTSSEALALASRDADVRIVLILTSVTDDEQILAGGGITDPSGLVGQRVAYAPGGDGELLLRGTLTAAQVPITQVTLVSAGGRDPGALLLAGAVDAAVVTGAQAQTAVAADATLDAVATAGDQTGLLSTVLVVRAETARAKPGQVLAFVRGWQSMYLYERGNVDLIAGDIAARRGEPVADTTVQLQGVNLLDVPANAVDLLPGGEYYDRTISAINAAASAAGWLQAPVDERSLIDGSFAQSVASAR